MYINLKWIEKVGFGTNMKIYLYVNTCIVKFFLNQILNHEFSFIIWVEKIVITLFKTQKHIQHPKINLNKDIRN